ncbi:hypothetical protein [Cryptosporangium sp. NPDC048952]|uniref:hypothetical protein n=1 Tax=Cryptosporangium sp. NPDC048952 TaxID=3363961 RepID=UPI003721EDFC
MTAVHLEVGAAALVAALTASGYEVLQQGEFVTFAYRIEVGTRAGEEIRIGLQIPGDWPMSPPPGPHISPPFGHPGGAVHPSPLGTDWEYWSRPAQNWPADRTVRSYLRHLRTLFSQI